MKIRLSYFSLLKYLNLIRTLLYRIKLYFIFAP
nr:MAG TPA: hypothetical protein [Caudoviricetes sp.]